MHLSRRSVLASGSGIIAGLSGCAHTRPGTPTPETVAKVFIAKGVISLETRGATLYGQLHAEEMTASSPPDPGSFDPNTGSFSVSGEQTARIEFKPGTLLTVTILSEQGVFDIFAQGKLVKQRAQRATIGSGRTPTTPEAPSAPGNSAATNRIYISQEAAEFDLQGASVSGQIGADGIEGRNLETSDNLDAATGSFNLRGNGRDIIRFNTGTLRALSALVEDGTVDVFYRGELLEQAADRFSRSFNAETGGVKNEPPETIPAVIDGFERGNVDPYRGGGDNAEFVVSDRVTRFGEYAGRIEANNTGTHWVSFPGDGLPQYPSRGDIFEFWMYNEPGDGASSVFFGVQEDGPAYRVNHEYVHNRLAIYKTSGGRLGTRSTGGLSGGLWRKYQVEWGNSGKIRFSLPRERIDLIVEDSTWDTGGFGWGLGWYNFNGVGYFDGAQIVG